MPCTHEGLEVSPETPSTGDLSNSTGSPPSIEVALRHRTDAEAVTAQPVSDPNHDAFISLSAQVPNSALPVSVPVRSNERWSRLGWSVWQRNQSRLDRRRPKDVPHWLDGHRKSLIFPFDECLQEDELPLRYGIQLDSHRESAPVQAMAQIIECPVRDHANTHLLQFPHGDAPDICGRGQHDDGVLPFRARPRQSIAFFSLTGGTGRTSLAAGMARLLAGIGLNVLLVDTSSFSLLPRLFGAADARQGVIRNFFPLSGERNRMISLISLAVDPFAGDDFEQYRILEEMKGHASRVDRVVWDLSGAPLEWASKVLGTCPQILVPLLPDMNSLMQLRATERFLNRCHDDDPSPRLRYVLNHFDADDMLHQDMLGRFQRQLGSKLLRGSMRCSSLVDEAMFCGRTIVDHAPGSLLVEDLWHLAQQLHQVDEYTEATSTPSEWYEQ